MSIFSSQPLSSVRFDLVSSPAINSPTLVQHLGGGQEYDNVGSSQSQTGVFQYFFPNPTRSGNALVLALSYVSDGVFSSISDDGGNTWPGSPAVTTTGSGGRIASLFVLPNCNAGTKSVSISFTAATGGIHIAVSEFNNIATTSPVNGTQSAANVAAPNLATGSFTPTANNDANGGNLIYAYFSNAPNSNSHAPDSFTAGSGFTLAEAAWSANLRTHIPANSYFQRATEFFVQTTQGSINPSLTAVNENVADSYLCLAIALKVASAGTAAPSSGIYVRRVNHYAPPFPTTAASTVINCPSTGNLRVIGATDPNCAITSITDSDGKTYTAAVTPGSTFGWLFYAENCSPNNALQVTINTSSANASIGDASFRFFDIERAKTSSSLGATATFSGNINFPPGKTNDAPIITPTQANSLIIAQLGNDFGPILNNFNPAAPNPTPSAAIFDLINYNGQVDDSLVDNSDALAHYYTPSTSAIHWNWVCTSQQPGNNLWGMAVEFLPA